MVDCKRCRSLSLLNSVAHNFHRPELIVGPSRDQLDYYLYGRSRARQHVAPFNGVISKVMINGVYVFYYLLGWSNNNTKNHCMELTLRTFDPCDCIMIKYVYQIMLSHMTVL